MTTYLRNDVILYWNYMKRYLRTSENNNLEVEERMVKINDDLLKRCSSKHLLSMGTSEELQQELLARVTHLYLQGQNIRIIENLEKCKSLMALYLSENKIQRIENLHNIRLLSCLHLQYNYITKIENLETLSNLSILNLAHNRISVVEGLENVPQLKELWIEYQALPSNISLTFSINSIHGVSKTLKLLNVSGNNLTSLTDLKHLQHLEKLYAEDNMVCTLQNTLNSFSNMPHLSHLRLNGNPICNVRRYRDDVVVTCLELGELDGKSVNETYREFLLNWKQRLVLLERKKKSDKIIRPFLESQSIHQSLLCVRPPGSSRKKHST